MLLDVAFHSYSSRTGWGRRQLNGKEIAGAMDLPLWFSTSPLFGPWMTRHTEGLAVPLKPFQALMSLWMRDEEIPPSAAPTPNPESVSPTEVEDAFWIPELGKLLPGNWVEAGEISDIAAKADDAQIYTGLWDQRILLVLPQYNCEDLAVLRRFFYFIWCQKLCRCFGRFMTAKHGHGWQSTLFKLRRLRRLGAEATQPHQGGLVYFQLLHLEESFSLLHLEKSSRLSFEGMTGEDNKKNLVELLEDGDMGAVALSKGLNSSWWEWTQGSSLFFWRWDVTQRKAARDGMEIFV
jgi:hypothetical protein